MIVRSLKAGDQVEWTTSAPHDRVLIEGVADKFDIGAFEITQAQPTPDQKLDLSQSDGRGRRLRDRIVLDRDRRNRPQ